MKKYLQLIRWQNLLIIALTQYLMRWCIIYGDLNYNINYQFKIYKIQFSGFDFLLLVIATMLIAAAGYMINDYFDRQTDMVNHSDKVLVETHISRKMIMALHSIFNIIGIGLGIYISIRAGHFFFSMIFFIATGALWFYSVSYKRYFLFSNLWVALLTGMIPLLVIVFEIPLLNKEYNYNLIAHHENFNSIIQIVLGFSFFAFITNFIREIVKDTEDVEGDKFDVRRSIPLVTGIVFTKILIIALCLFTIACIMFSYFSFLNHYLIRKIYTHIYFALFLVLPLMYLIWQVIRAKTSRDYHVISVLLKFIMIAGILYSIVFYFSMRLI